MSNNKYPIHSDYRLLARMGFNIYDEPSIRIANYLAFKVDFTRVDRDIRADHYIIESYDGSNIDIYVYRPMEYKEVLPALLYTHGGGFYLRGDILNPRIMSDYIRRFPMVIIYIDYRLSLDYPYPTGLEDSYAGLKWAWEHADLLGIDPERIGVAGYSAGGALAAGLTMLARDRGLDILKVQALISPVTDHRQVTDSVQKFTDTPHWTTSSNKFMWDVYLRDIKGEIPEYASPLTASDLKKLPPAYIEVAQFDPLHDEGVEYYKKIVDSNVYAELNDTKGTIHMSSNYLKSKETQKHVDRMIEFLRRYLDVGYKRVGRSGS